MIFKIIDFVGDPIDLLTCTPPKSGTTSWIRGVAVLKDRLKGIIKKPMDYIPTYLFKNRQKDPVHQSPNSPNLGLFSVRTVWPERAVRSKYFLLGVRWTLLKDAFSPSEFANKTPIKNFSNVTKVTVSILAPEFGTVSCCV